jgi:hypothetical protein
MQLSIIRPALIMSAAHFQDATELYGGTTEDQARAGRKIASSSGASAPWCGASLKTHLARP